MRSLTVLMLFAGVAAAHGMHVTNPVSGATHHVTTTDESTGVLIAALATGVLLAAAGLALRWWPVRAKIVSVEA
jgi:hypothetical protein